MKKIAVHLATGFEEVEAITVIDVLRRAGISVIIVSMTEDLIVKGSHAIAIRAELLFKEVDYQNIDMIVLPGGMPGTNNLDKHEGLKNKILEFNRQNKMLGAICAGPLVFGHLNLLKGKRAVCYPGFEKELFGAIIKDEPAVKDGNIITGKGVGTALCFALKIVEVIENKEKADTLSKAMVMEAL